LPKTAEEDQNIQDWKIWQCIFNRWKPCWQMKIQFKEDNSKLDV
jgi:hypothetical protein